MMKHCYIRLDQDLHVLYNDRFIEVMLCENEDGSLMCHLAGCDDWELSHTGPDAEAKFNALLNVSGDVSFQYLLDLGFTQYG